MNQGYFRQVAAQTQTRLWINNPTVDEAKMALHAGAIACTTNPTYVARLLRLPDAKEDTLRIIDQVISEIEDDTEAAALIQRKVISHMASCFMPRYTETNGHEGFVSLQMDPCLEQDPAKIVAEALSDFEMFPNCIAKIPVIPSGLTAIDCLVRLNKPVIATEIMAISQAIAVCDVYRKASEESGNTPAFFVTHISGILDEHFKAEADSLGVTLSPEAIRLAGCSIAKKQYTLMRERNLPGILLGGGARDLHHFTELVGGKVHITLNWQGSACLLEENPPAIENNMDKPVPLDIINELCEKLPTFKKAWDEDDLKPGEFDDFGPVVRFRTQFLNGWNKLLETIRERRSISPPKSIKTDQSQMNGILPVLIHRSFCKVGDNPSVEIRPGIFRSTLVYNQDNMLCHFHENAGAPVDLHTHVAIQCGYVLHGKVKFFDAQGNERILVPGDGYLFNSNEPHGSVALEETDLIECFSPARPEYLD
jgi:transaldolase